MKNLNRNQKSKYYKTSIAIIFILVLSVVGLELFNIFLSNRVTTDSIEASKLKKEIAEYTQKNNILKSKIYEHASYDSIASRAAEVGFQEARDTISLDTPVHVARQ